MYLRRLLEALPEQSNDLAYVINQTFPDVLSSQTPVHVREVPKEIYRRVLDLLTTIPEDDARRWHVIQTLCESALHHLDAAQHGFAITYAQLMPAYQDGIHSLREVMMRGYAPWPRDRESRAYLGSTTLAGTAVMLQRLHTWDSLDDEERLQVDVDAFERSVAACPVVQAGRIGGVLVASSTQPGFFADKLTCQAIIEYAQLMSLGLREEAFVDPSLIHLRPFPALSYQRTEIAHSYLSRILVYARRHKVSRQEAEYQVVREMEREFEGEASS
jgi:hypothetical protein